MTELITVPSFIFHQDDEDNYETPIQVNYYNGSIELVQKDKSVLLTYDSFEKLFKDIKKHKTEALYWLEKR